MPNNLLIRFARYCHERFPIFSLLLLSGLSLGVLQKLSSTYTQVIILNLGNYLYCLCLIIYLYFTIRVLDEIRDYKSDAILHPDRPVPRGLISVKELIAVNLVWLGLLSIFNFTFIGILNLTCTVIIFVLLLSIITYLANKVRLFWVHNLILSVGNIALLGAVYYLLQLDFSQAFVWKHLFFSFAGSYLIEVIRKIDKVDVDGYRKNTDKITLKILLLAPVVALVAVTPFGYFSSILYILVIYYFISLIKNRYKLVRILGMNIYILSMLLIIFV
ncbi:MAG: UbiA family prenyltransferase [Candidatus Parcubacteria bacterium]|nr:UbiA family prenyltransferase [Candidatus Paceibacterota bacterium]